MTIKKRLLLILALVLLIPTGVSLAQEPVNPEPITDDQVNDIAGELYCPVCENIPLDVCGTQACADWRQEIRDMLADGRSEAEIKAYFSDRYGQRVLATPDKSGANLFVWIAPPAAVLIGAVVLVGALRKMAPEAHAPEVKVTYDDTELDPAYVERVEAEILELKGA